MSYSLMDGPTRHQEAPYTFFLPHPALVDAIKVGDLVKLGFEYDPPGEKYDAERMWVDVDRIDNDVYHGHLANEPDDPRPGIQYRDELSFSRENILDVLLIDRSRLPDIERDPGRYPSLPAEREYWDRCLVDECVLRANVPVEYIYREEPDLARSDDEFPDSGWRIRGRESQGENMDDRTPAYVALGAVLNKDDSWLHLIDSSVGSAFMRDFETNSYEPAA